jgi:hypothetical protein
MPTVCHTHHSDDNALVAAALKVSFQDDSVLRTLVPDDDDWEKTATGSFAWYCWVYHASYGMMDVAEDIEVAGDIQCAALWEPAAMTLQCSFSSFSGSAASRISCACSDSFRNWKRSDTSTAQRAHHLMILGSKVQGKGVSSKLIKPGIASATALGLSCYLGSSNPLKVPFYERMCSGFRVVELLYPFENDSLVHGGQRGGAWSHSCMVRDAEELKKRK